MAVWPKIGLLERNLNYISGVLLRVVKSSAVLQVPLFLFALLRWNMLPLEPETLFWGRSSSSTYPDYSCLE